MRRSPKAPNTKEKEGSSKRMTQRKGLNPLQEAGDITRPIHPRDQERFSAMDLPPNRRNMPNREVCPTVKPFLRWHSGSPVCCGLFEIRQGKLQRTHLFRFFRIREETHQKGSSQIEHLQLL